MKKLVILTLLIFASCNKKAEMERIEIMAYYYNFNENNTAYIPSPILYSKIDNIGDTKILRTKWGKVVSVTKTKIPRSCLKSIIAETKNKNENDFRIEFDSTSNSLYCGPIIRFRIKYKNGQDLTFLVDNHSSRKAKFLSFTTLYDKLFTEPLLKPKTKSQVDSILKDQNKFSKFSLQKDLINLPAPPGPAPKIDEVKFIKK